MNPIKTGSIALALACVSLTAACGGVEDEDPTTLTQEDGSITLAAALSADDSLSVALGALEQSALSDVLESRASYTLLAPNDAAFEALGETGQALLEDEGQRPILVGLLRSHMLPGHLTPEAIGEAIERNGGPVTMTTLGDTEVTFSRDGEAIAVSAGGSEGASFAGAAVATSNGVVIPIDTVLLPPPAG